jgi:hypothetical protein
MVKKIKLRAWDNERKCFCKNNAIASLDMYGELQKQSSIYEITEFTNLLDINKKEIYDGDILEYLIEGKEYFRELYLISFSEERSCWQINIINKCNHINSPQFYSAHLTQSYASCFKIVGNIFENKDLLEQSPTSQTSPNGDFSNEKEHNISLKDNSNELSQISSNDETSLNNNIRRNF